MERSRKETGSLHCEAGALAPEPSAGRLAEHVSLLLIIRTKSERALELSAVPQQPRLASIVDITRAELNVTQAQIENVNANCDYQNAWATRQ